LGVDPAAISSLERRPRLAHGQHWYRPLVSVIVIAIGAGLAMGLRMPAKRTPPAQQTAPAVACRTGVLASAGLRRHGDAVARMIAHRGG